MTIAIETPVEGHPHERAAPTAATLTGRCAETGYLVSVSSLFPSADIVDQWRDLAARALVPNLFYEPEFAQAASIPFGKGVQLLTIRQTDAGRERLLLAWPFRIARGRWGIPLSVMLGWGHPFACLGVPLVDAEHADSAIASLLNVRRTIPTLPPRALFQLIPEDGPFSQILQDVEHRRGQRFTRTERHDRPDWRRGVADDPLATLSSSTQAKLRQGFRGLEREGRVFFETITDHRELPAALEDYLALEASGWKARAGTAIPQSESQTAFMRQLIAALGAQHRVRVDRLRIGHTTLASSISYLYGAHHAWNAKISYNEDYAKFSPGSHLVLKITDDYRLNTALTYADSCAPAGHPLMRRFWTTRFFLSNVVVALGEKDRLLGLAGALEQLRPRVRDFAYRVRDTLRSRLRRRAQR